MINVQKSRKVVDTLPRKKKQRNISIKKNKRQRGGTTQFDYAFWSALTNKALSKRGTAVPSALDKFKSYILTLFYKHPTDFCEAIHSFIPKYEVKNETSYQNELCFIMILVGFLTKLLESECSVFLKGGKAVELVLSNINETNKDQTISKKIPAYESNDIDIVILPYEKSQHTARDIAIQIGFFIQWLTMPDPHATPALFATQRPQPASFIFKDMPKPSLAFPQDPDVGSIVKIALRETGGKIVPLLDVGYVLPTEKFNSREGIRSQNHLFIFNKYPIFYNTQTMKDMIVERIHYILQYTTLDNPPPHIQKFIESLKRSTNALLYGIMVQNITYVDYNSKPIKPIKTIEDYKEMKAMEEYEIIVNSEIREEYEKTQDDIMLKNEIIKICFDFYYNVIRDPIRTPEQRTQELNHVIQFLSST